MVGYVFWCFEMLLTNAYLAYNKFHILHNQKPLSHYEFHRQVVLAWLKPEEYWPKKTRQREGTDPSVSTTSTTRALRSLYSQGTNESTKRCHRVTAKSLHSTTGNLKDRLSVNNTHLPIKTNKKDSCCQLHYLAAKKKFRSNLVCSTNNVTLCI